MRSLQFAQIHVYPQNCFLVSSNFWGMIVEAFLEFLPWHIDTILWWLPPVKNIFVNVGHHSMMKYTYFNPPSRTLGITFNKWGFYMVLLSQTTKHTNSITKFYAYIVTTRISASHSNINERATCQTINSNILWRISDITMVFVGVVNEHNWGASPASYLSAAG